MQHTLSQSEGQSGQYVINRPIHTIPLIPENQGNPENHNCQPRHIQSSQEWEGQLLDGTRIKANISFSCNTLSSLTGTQKTGEKEDKKRRKERSKLTRSITRLSAAERAMHSYKDTRAEFKLKRQFEKNTERPNHSRFHTFL